jgi:hypothetical protein
MAVTADPQGFHIFLSYRREGTAVHAVALHQNLVLGVEGNPGFSDDQIFMDIDTIAPGDDFHDVIREAVAKCDVLLALIGPQWMDAKDRKGRRRLDNPDDFVRIEIEAALQRKVPVVPILVDGAAMPEASELPESMAPLARRHAHPLDATSWKYDLGRLLASLKKREAAKTKRPPKRPAATPQRATKRKAASSARTVPQNARKKTSGAGRQRAAPRQPAAEPKEESMTERSAQSAAAAPTSFIEQAYLEFRKAHKVGDVVEGRVTALIPTCALIYLATGVNGEVSPGTLRLDQTRQNAFRFDLADGRFLLASDVVRVRIEKMNPPSVDWDRPPIELSLVDLIRSDNPYR